MAKRRHLATVTGLVCLCCLLQALIICRATVPALDAARFAHIAEAIDQQGLLSTVRHQQEQPLFPVWLWCVHRGLQRWAGDFPSIWAASTQLAAAVPLVLTIVPLYFLSLRLYGSTAALAGSFFFCLLPEASRLGADGISDSTHLLMFCLAFWAIVVYFTGRVGRGAMARVRDGERVDRPASAAPDQPTAVSRQPAWLLLAGAATAMAALTRVEGLSLPASLAVTLAVFQFQSARRQPYWSLAVAVGCLVLGLAAVLGPYLVAMGALTPRAAVSRILARPASADASRPTAQSNQADAAAWQLADGQPMSFAAKDPGSSMRRRGLAAALLGFGSELSKAFWYWIGMLALFGLWRVRRLRGTPADWFVRVFLFLYCLTVVWFVAQEGYLCARHLLPLVVAGIGCAGYGATELAQSITNWAGIGPAGQHPACAGRFCWSRQHAATAMIVLLAGTGCLWQTLKPVGRYGLGHRAAAEWLATHAQSLQAVVDTRGWTGLYSGCKTYPYQDGRAAFSDRSLAYAVLEQQELQSESSRGRTLRYLLGVAGERVGLFAGPTSEKLNRDVAVYRWHPDRFWRHVAQRTALFGFQENPNKSTR